MQDTKQPKVLEKIQHMFVEIEEEVEDGFGSTELESRRIIQPSELAEPFIEIAASLLREKEARGCLGRDLSDGELACLLGISEGFNRATNASYEEPEKDGK
jgi:hypothetical protein